MTNHDPFRVLIEAYALGALDTEERADLEAHLRSGCAECSAALDEARSLVTRLAYLAPDAAPSDLLKGRVMQVARAESSLSRARARTPFWMWAAAAAVFVFAVYNAGETYVLRRKIAVMRKSTATSMQNQENLRSRLLQAERQAMILTDPRTQTFVLAASEKHWPQMKAMWHEKYGLCIMGQNIPMPKANRTLQLWLMPKTPGSKLMPSMALRPDPDGRFCLVVAKPPEDMHNTEWIEITEEPAGGSSQPTTSPIWMSSIS